MDFIKTDCYSSTTENFFIKAIIVVVARLNINSVGSKFGSRISQIANSIDMPIVLEAKLDETIDEFSIQGLYVLCRVNRNRIGTEIIFLSRKIFLCRNRTHIYFSR